MATLNQILARLEQNKSNTSRWIDSDYAQLLIENELDLGLSLAYQEYLDSYRQNNNLFGTPLEWIDWIRFVVKENDWDKTEYEQEVYDIYDQDDDEELD